MVRALLGGLVAVGEGRHDAQWLTGVLEGRRRQPQVTVMPARGLTLEEVVYPDTAGLAVRASQSRRRRDEGLPEMSTPAPER
jgi:tRNA pseudouridine38-40 synthase